MKPEQVGLLEGLRTQRNDWQHRLSILYVAASKLPRSQLMSNAVPAEPVADKVRLF
jgi:hypothetical protein